MPPAFKALLNKTKAIVALAVCASAATAHAGFVSIDVAGLQRIYDQAGIELRYNPSRTVRDTALLAIDTDTEFGALSNYEAGGSVLSMFLVDSIRFCGYVVPNIVGCGATPGTLIALDSGFAASAPQAPTAMGHEIGHNLGLAHWDPVDPAVGDNLMNPATFIGTPAPLAATQIAQMFQSPLVQYDGDQAYLSITPFAVLASLDVHEPASIALVGMALLLLALSRRTRRTRLG